MKKFRENRRVYADDLRRLCIQKNWYTGGTNEEYEHLLCDLAGSKENIGTDDIIAIADDIMQHSHLDPEYGIESVAFEVAAIAHSFFEEIKSEFRVVMKSPGGVKHLLTTCETEKDAEDFCNQLDWEWVDPESGFVWNLEIDEVEF